MQIYDFNDNNLKEWFNNYITPYMKVEKVCYNTSDCWHKKDEVKDLNKNKAMYSNDPGMGVNTLSFINSKGAILVLMDGGNRFSKQSFWNNCKSAQFNFLF